MSRTTNGSKHNGSNVARRSVRSCRTERHRSGVPGVDGLREFGGWRLEIRPKVKFQRRYDAEKNANAHSLRVGCRGLNRGLEFAEVKPRGGTESHEHKRETNYPGPVCQGNRARVAVLGGEPWLYKSD